MANMVSAVPAHVDTVRIMRRVTRWMGFARVGSVNLDGKKEHVANVSTVLEVDIPVQ